MTNSARSREAALASDRAAEAHKVATRRAERITNICEGVFGLIAAAGVVAAMKWHSPLALVLIILTAVAFMASTVIIDRRVEAQRSSADRAALAALAAAAEARHAEREQA